MEPTELEARARRAYEWGRWRRGLATSSWAAPAIVLACFGCTPRIELVLAPLVVLAAAAMVWRGGALGRAVVPGLLAGTVPVLVPVVVRCGSLENAPQICLMLSLGGGVVSGLIVSAVEARLGAPRPQILAASLLAALTGTMGCAMFGLGGLAGLAAGLALGAAPGYLAVPRRA
jgi:hypothetical protein